MLCVAGADKNRYTDQTQNDRSQKDTTQKDTTQNGHVLEWTYSNLERTYPRTDISQDRFIQGRTYSRSDISQKGQILEWTNLRTDQSQNGQIKDDSEINFIISKFIYNKVYGLQFISQVRLVQVTLGQVSLGYVRLGQVWLGQDYNKFKNLITLFL